MLKFSRMTGLIALLLPATGIPLGLGDIELHSALNQSLDAEIGLLSLKGTPLDKIQVRLANKDEFERMGLDRPFFLNSLKLLILKGPDGRPYIQLSSPSAIKEPFIDMLLAVSWPQGRLVKEYTLLLDPPVFLEERSAPVSAPLVGVAKAVADQAKVAPVTVPVGQDLPRKMTPAKAAKLEGTASGVPSDGWSNAPDNGLRYGPVTRADTLWGVAKSLDTDVDTTTSATIPQIMLALLRDNPKAFYHQNVNELKAGYVLRLRDMASVTVLSRAKARTEVRRQYTVWRSRHSSQAGDRQQKSGKMTDAVAEHPEKPGQKGPHLELAAPIPVVADDHAAGLSAEAQGQMAPVVGEDSTGLRRGLMAALEASDVSQQENKALRDRLTILEKQLADMQRLLVLKGDTLATLQAHGSEAVAASSSGASGDAIPTVQPEPDLLDQLMGPYRWFALSGLGVILLLLAWLLKRRQLAAGDDLESVMPVESAETAVFNTKTADEDGVSAAVTQTDDSLTDEDGPSSAASLQSETESGFQGEQVTDDLLEDEIDTLSEADVYLAYRRFDKAEALLQDALRQEPDRHDFAVKLLEVYARSDNKDAFVLRAEALQVLLGDDESPMWHKVMELGRPLLGAHPLLTQTLTTDETAIPLDGRENDNIASQDLADISGEAVSEAEEQGSEFSGADMEHGDLNINAGKTSFDERDIPLEFVLSALEDRLAGNDVEHAIEDQTALVASEEVAATSSDATEVKAQAHNDAFRELEAEIDDLHEVSVLDDDMDWLDDVVDADLDDLLGKEDDSSDAAGSSPVASGPSVDVLGEDSVATHLDLARAYIDMGDLEAARAILHKVNGTVSDAQKSEIHELMKQIA